MSNLVAWGDEASERRDKTFPHTTWVSASAIWRKLMYIGC